MRSKLYLHSFQMHSEVYCHWLRAKICESKGSEFKLVYCLNYTQQLNHSKLQFYLETVENKITLIVG